VPIVVGRMGNCWPIIDAVPTCVSLATVILGVYCFSIMISEIGYCENLEEDLTEVNMDELFFGEVLGSSIHQKFILVTLKLWDP